MKPFPKTILAIAVVLLALTAGAQTNTKKSSSQKSKSKSSTGSTHHAAPVYGKEVQFTLKNLAEGTIPIFAGPKEDMKDILKRKTVGGLSTNKMFLRVNEVVCILKDGKTVSCGVVKPTTTTMEINISGTAITVK
jgi:hypothetical protein